MLLIIIILNSDYLSILSVLVCMSDNCGDVGGPAKCYIYDPTQLEARKTYWKHIHEGYYQYGIKVFCKCLLCFMPFLLPLLLMPFFDQHCGTQ